VSQSKDKDLADRFAAMRRAERAAAPAFANVRARAIRRRSLRAPLAIGLAAAVAAIVIGVLASRNRVEQAPVGIDLRAGSWTGPTDFLLDTPGHWMLRDLPEIASPSSMQFDTTSYRRTTS